MIRYFALIQFDDFFQAATEKPSPYGYQCRLASGLFADPDKPDTFCSQLTNVPIRFGGI